MMNADKRFRGKGPETAHYESVQCTKKIHPAKRIFKELKL